MHRSKKNKSSFHNWTKILVLTIASNFGVQYIQYWGILSALQYSSIQHLYHTVTKQHLQLYCMKCFLPFRSKENVEEQMQCNNQKKLKDEHKTMTVLQNWWHFKHTCDCLKIALKKLGYPKYVQNVPKLNQTFQKTVQCDLSVTITRMRPPASNALTINNIVKGTRKTHDKDTKQKTLVSGVLVH